MCFTRQVCQQTMTNGFHMNHTDAAIKISGCRILLSFPVILSVPKQNDSWSNEQGALQQDLLKSYIAASRNVSLYHHVDVASERLYFYSAKITLKIDPNVHLLYLRFIWQQIHYPTLCDVKWHDYMTTINNELEIIFKELVVD
jgi:hypothetical protein